MEGAKENPALLTIPKAANYLGLTDRSLKHLIYTRQVSIVHVGRRVFLRRTDLDFLVENGTR